MNTYRNIYIIEMCCAYYIVIDCENAFFSFKYIELCWFSALIKKRIKIELAMKHISLLMLNVIAINEKLKYLQFDLVSFVL